MLDLEKKLITYKKSKFVTVRSREPSGCGAEPRKVTDRIENPVKRYQPYNREG